MCLQRFLMLPGVCRLIFGSLEPLLAEAVQRARAMLCCSVRQPSRHLWLKKGSYPLRRLFRPYVEGRERCNQLYTLSHKSLLHHELGRIGIGAFAQAGFLEKRFHVDVEG